MSPTASGRRRSDHRRLVTVLATLVGGLLLAGCAAISEDREPVALPPELIPAELTEQTSPPATLPADVPASDAVLWFVGSDGGDEQLVACTVSVPEAASSADRAVNLLRELVQLNPAEDESCAASLTNSLPPDLTILASSLTGNVLDLDLSALGTVSATAQRLAVAQIVFTATELPEVGAVRFSIDGELRAVPLEDATAEPGALVTRSDFPRFDRFAAAQSGLTPEETTDLLRLLEALAAAEEAEAQASAGTPTAP